MSSVTIYGGVGEIGGNKILIESGKSKIFLDFGMSFKKAGEYYTDFLQPRKCNGIRDFLEFGLLPDLKGIYREDYLRHCGMSEEPDQSYLGVFLSHAHADHAAYIHHLREDIPIYSTPTTKTILDVMQTTGSATFGDYIEYSDSFKIGPKSRGEGFSRKREKRERAYRTFRSGQRIDLNDLSITPFSVDHSLPGACGFIVNADGLSIGYTGDLRFHGRKSDFTRKFVSAAEKEGLDVLITEGTNITEESGLSEEEVRHRISEAIAETKNLVVVNFPIRDAARLTSFYEATKENGRNMVISTKQALLLRKLREAGEEDLPDPSDLLVYLSRKSWGTIGNDSYPQEIIEQDYDKWEREFIYAKNAVNYRELRDMQEEAVFFCDFYSLKDLIDMRPEEGSTYIRSVCEPFDDEMLLDYNLALRWLEHFGLTPLKQIHASGHAHRPELIDMIERIAPKKVIPVHTEHPELFQHELAGKVDEVMVPDYGRRYEF